MVKDVSYAQQLNVYYELISLRGSLAADKEYCIVCLQENCTTHDLARINYRTALEVSGHLMEIAKMEAVGLYHTIQDVIVPRIDVHGTYSDGMKYIAVPIQKHLALSLIHISYADTWFIHGVSKAIKIPKPIGIGVGSYYGFADAELAEFHFICAFKNYEFFCESKSFSTRSDPKRIVIARGAGIGSLFSNYIHLPVASNPREFLQGIVWRNPL